jgi:hypothetical protein
MKKTTITVLLMLGSRVAMVSECGKSKQDECNNTVS